MKKLSARSVAKLHNAYLAIDAKCKTLYAKADAIENRMNPVQFPQNKSCQMNCWLLPVLIDVVAERLDFGGETNAHHKAGVYCPEWKQPKDENFQRSY